MGCGGCGVQVLAVVCAFNKHTGGDAGQTALFAEPMYTVNDMYTPPPPTEPTVQPLRVVQPAAVCVVGGSTPDLSYEDLGIFLGGGQTEKFVH